MSFISIKKLFFNYDREKKYDYAIDDVSLSINEGDFVVILGKNGSGKSSLAKQLNALLLPTGGDVWVDGIDTKDEESIWTIRQNVGMVLQNPDNQIVSTNVEEDVAFGPENLCVPLPELQERVDYALESVGMSEYKEKNPLRLSGGQKQRIAIAGIIAMEPKCIVLDEPTAMLDPVGREDVIRTLKYLNKEKNITVILITHYMEEATNADYVYVMSDGKIKLSGKPEDVFIKEDEIRECGLESLQISKLASLLREGGMDIPKDIIHERDLLTYLGKVLK